MYRCGHCGDLHFSSDQAWRCAECGDDWVPGAVERDRRERMARPLPWDLKLRWRRRQPATRSEQELRRRLLELLPAEAVLSQWWLDECDYLADFFVPPVGLVIEVDGASHRGREGADRHRSGRIRDCGYDVARATAAHVMAAAESIAAQIAFWVGGVPAAAEPAECAPAGLPAS